MTNRLSLRTKWAQIPLTEDGDPDFKRLNNGTGEFGDPQHLLPAIQDVFTNDEIVEMVNRYLYSAKYQRESHAKNYERKRPLTPRFTKEAQEGLAKEAEEAVKRETDAIREAMEKGL